MNDIICMLTIFFFKFLTTFSGSSFALPLPVFLRVVWFMHTTVGHVETDILLLVASSTKKHLTKKKWWLSEYVINCYNVSCYKCYNISLITCTCKCLNITSRDFDYFLTVCRSIELLNTVKIGYLRFHTCMC